MTLAPRAPRFSFLLPTRKNLTGLQHFFQSVTDTTQHLDELEIVLAVDADDLDSQQVTHSSLALKKIVLPPGATMGALNRACFELSSGRYVMLVNDDIVIRTPAWDVAAAKVFTEYPDEIVLVHVNDLLFRERLCTFPMLSRRACVELGICPAEYRRYRIDDHIYDTYSLLAHLGHRRIVYLPDVIFEHRNHSSPPETPQGQTFTSVDNKTYAPNQAILELDACHFDKTLQTRKQDAQRLARLIDESRYTRLQTRQHTALAHLHPARRVAAYQAALDGVRDSYSYRRAEFVQRRAQTMARPARVTVAVVTSDLRKEYAARCLTLIKAHTHNYDLLVLDNNGSPNFRHTHEMNRILRAIETDYLVLMDDDVYVAPGWLDGLLECMDDRTALVAPMHQDRLGALSFSGVYFVGDDKGTHAHLVDRPDQPRMAQTVCSALILIDVRKCADIFMDEFYAKYFLDLDYSLQVWEAGYQVVVTPAVTVTHLGGATMTWGSVKANVVQERDRQYFVNRWINTRRLMHLEQGPWQNYPELRYLSGIARQLHNFFDNAPTDNFEASLSNLMSITQGYLMFQKTLALRLEEYLASAEAAGQTQHLAYGLAVLQTLYETSASSDKRPRWKAYLGYVDLFITTARQDPPLAIRKALKKIFGGRATLQPLLVESNYFGFNLVRYHYHYWGLALTLGPMDVDKLPETLLTERRRSGLIVAGRLRWEVKGKILWSHLRRVGAMARRDSSATARKVGARLFGPKYAATPKLMARNYYAYNIVHYQRAYYGLALTMGPLNVDELSEATLLEAQEQARIVLGYSVSEVKRQIWRHYWGRVLGVARADSQQFWRKVRQKLFGSKDAAHARLVAHDVRGYNIVHYRTAYYGLAQALGPLEMETLSEAALRDYQASAAVIVGHSADEVKRQIWRGYWGKVLGMARADSQQFWRKVRQKLFGSEGAAHARLVAHDVRGYNIVRYRTAYYGLAQALGPLEMETLSEATLRDYQTSGAVIIGHSAGEVRLRIAWNYLKRILMLVRKDPRQLAHKALRKLRRG